MISSRAHTPNIPPDEDSMMSSPRGAHRDDRSELLKVLDEVSSSSNDGDGDSDEEDMQASKKLVQGLWGSWSLSRRYT